MTRTPRIFAMISSRVFYGQERANLLVMESLKAQGCEILAVVEDHPLCCIMPQELERRCLPYVKAPAIGRRAKGDLLDFLLGNPIRYLRFRKQMRTRLQLFRPTHIHVPNPFAFLMADAIAHQDLPIIYRIGDRPSRHNAFMQLIWRRITRRVTHFVANSCFIADELAGLGIPPQKISVIYNKPPTRSHPPQPNVPPQQGHILFIGQLSSSKGVDRLIEAFRQVAPDFPDARLTVLGRISGWSGDDWQRSLRDRTWSDPLIGNRVSFPGEQEDVFHYLASAAFLVVPSVAQDPLPNVVGEAKAAARPSVVFPSGGLPELIQHGEDGFICRDTSIPALVEGLRYYLVEPDRAHEHGHNALGSMTRFGFNQFEQSWRAVYDATTLSSSSTTTTIRSGIDRIR